MLVSIYLSYVKKLRFNYVSFWFAIVKYFILSSNYNIPDLQTLCISNKVRNTLFFRML